MSRIRPARVDEAGALSALAIRSKAVWGYSDAFMAACRAELTLAPDDIAARPTFVAEHGGRVVGFYALGPLGDGRVELDMLFVEPDAIGAGHGRALIEHARRTARESGYATMVIQGDPHAARFYEAAGATRVGERPSRSIPGRALPLFELVL